MTPDNSSGYPSDEILQKSYDARDNVWKKVGRLDDQVLAHVINPSFQGMPSWPNLRQSYNVVHLDNGHTIIATDGLSDPFMDNHPFYKPGVNGFGLELYIEITEPFDMAKAGYSWWYNLLYQEALQAAFSGDLLENIDKYGGTLSTELYDVHGLPEAYKHENRAPVLIGAASRVVPPETAGPLSPIRFISITLLTLDELQYVIDNSNDGREEISKKLLDRFGGPISALDRPSVVEAVSHDVKSESNQLNTGTTDVMLTVDATKEAKKLDHEAISRLESLLNTKFQDIDAFWADDDEHTFYELFVDVMAEHDTCAMKVDWKWDATVMFWWLEKLLPEHQIKLTKSGDDPTYVAYDIEFTFDGATERLTVGFENPSAIIEVVNRHLTDERFVRMDLGEDGYAWLLAPSQMDSQTFTEITGMRILSVSPPPGERQAMELRAESSPKITEVPAVAAPAPDTIGNRLDLVIKQSWLEKSSDAALEEFKSVVVDVLNSLPEDRHAENRWSITKISEGDEAYLIYDERPLATLKIADGSLMLQTQAATPRYDDVMYAIRYAANRLLLAVYSNIHGGARLPQNYRLAIDPSYFRRDKDVASFFGNSKFIPRFAPEGVENIGDGRQALVIYPPYYAEHKEDGSIHITNDAMLKFLIEKDDQRVSREFSYKVADSMQDFAKKYDLGLVPSSFYQNHGGSTKIINDTYFDIGHINRKVFINPYVWDFDGEHDYRFYKNVKNGMHFMDKVRKGENLDTALKRVLREELEVAGDYVGARVVALEFDRDREGILTPRLIINIFVHGMTKKHNSQSHDWVSIK